jgi:hypothetical protein
MKKLPLLSLIIIMAFSAALKAAALDSFQVFLGGGQAITAGTTIAVTITAIDTTSGIKTDYTGPIALTASVGNIIVAQAGTTFTTAADAGNTLTQAFSGGRWTGNITFTGAAVPVTITCVDYTGGYSGNGTAFQNVIPGNFSNFLILTEGMTWAPGTPSDPSMLPGDGYTGAPVTLTTYTAFNVTVLAVDAWSNTIVAGFPNVTLSTSAAHTALTPTSVDLSVDSNADTVFAVTIYPSPDKTGGQSITVHNLPSVTVIDTLPLYFTSLSDHYIWADAPSSVVAGVPFSVSVTVSHFPPPPDGNGQPISDFTNQGVKISGVDSVTRSPLAPGLFPSSSLSGYTNSGVMVLNGVTYTKSSATGIRIRPLYTGTDYIMTNESDLDRDSGNIIVYAAAPSTFTASVSSDKISDSEIAAISVNVYDRYGNSVSNTAVDFAINSGTVQFQESAGNTATVVSNASGTAVVHYSSLYDTRAYISFSVEGLSGITGYQTIEVGSILSSTEISNFPNPFNPDRGPTNIKFYLTDNAQVSLKLYSFSGQTVWSKDYNLSSGENVIPWNGMTNSNMTVGTGLYTLKVKVSGAAGDYTLTRKIAVSK